MSNVLIKIAIYFHVHFPLSAVIFQTKQANFHGQIPLESPVFNGLPYQVDSADS